MPRRGDQPASGVVGAVIRPRLDGPDQRLPHGVLGGREVRPAVDEGRQDAGDQVPQLGLVPRVGGHHSVTQWHVDPPKARLDRLDQLVNKTDLEVPFAAPAPVPGEAAQAQLEERCLCRQSRCRTENICFGRE
jgi:hypothetical protein